MGLCLNRVFQLALDPLRRAALHVRVFSVCFIVYFASFVCFRVRLGLFSCFGVFLGLFSGLDRVFEPLLCVLQLISGLHDVLGPSAGCIVFSSFFAPQRVLGPFQRATSYVRVFSVCFIVYLASFVRFRVRSGLCFFSGLDRVLEPLLCVLQLISGLHDALGPLQRACIVFRASSVCFMMFLCLICAHRVFELLQRAASCV